MAVVFYHSILVDRHLARDVLPSTVQNLSSGYDVAAKMVLASVSGAQAVLLFFVLSGFVLKLSFDKEGSGLVQGYNFVVRRLCRLYPAMLFAMAFLFVVSTIAVFLGSDVRQFVAGSTPSVVLQNAVLWKITVHGASWTIQAELLVIPFLLLAFSIVRMGGFAASVACLVYAMFAMKYPVMVGNVPWMPQSLAAFMAGMVAADARMKPVFSATTQPIMIGLVLALMATKLFFTVTGMPVRIANVLFCMGLVGCVYHASASMPFIRVLNSKPAQFLGRISYSLYLVNIPLIWVFMTVLPTEIGPLERGLLIGLLAAICSVPVAAFSERVFERGGIALGRALTIRKRLRLAPAE